MSGCSKVSRRAYLGDASEPCHCARHRRRVGVADGDDGFGGAVAEHLPRDVVDVAHGAQGTDRGGLVGVVGVVIGFAVSLDVEAELDLADPYTKRAVTSLATVGYHKRRFPRR